MADRPELVYPKTMRWAAGAIVSIAILVMPGWAAAQVVFGYQLGVTQSVGTTVGDDLNTITFLAEQDNGNTQTNANSDMGAAGATTVQPTDVTTAGVNVSALQGIQLNTQATANLTFDIITRTLNHGLVLGLAVGQLIPVAVPDSQIEVAGEAVDLNAQLRERINTLQASATYLARLQRATWSLAFGGNYAFGLNGRLSNGASGGVGAAVTTLPAAQAGAFAFSGVTHTAGSQIQLQVTKQNWDLVLGTTYNYSKNGIYTLAAGAVGGQGQAGAAATNVGAFVPANLHAITPTLVTRLRLGRRGVLSLNANSTYSVASEILDDFAVEVNGETIITRAPAAPPETLINTARLEYSHQFGRTRTVGANFASTLSFRVASDAGGVALPGATLATDALINTVQVFFRDNLPWQVRANLSAGVAQSTLYQAPFGSPVDASAPFALVRSSPEAVGNLTLQRRFEPIDVTLVAARGVGVGALGASAIVAESAGLTLQHILDLGERRLVTSLGANAQRTQGVGQELFGGVDPNDPLVAAFNNYGYGATAAMALPLIVTGPFSVDATLTYNYNWVNTDPGDLIDGLTPLATHVGLFTLRGVFGRGTAQGAAGIGGRVDSDELDAFSANPASGAPLLTQRLLRQGAPLQTGERPGEAVQPRRDSRQAYRQSIRQQKIEQEARQAAGAMLGTGSSEVEEERALEEEKEKQKKLEEERALDLFDWPEDEAVSLPDSADPVEP